MKIEFREIFDKDLSKIDEILLQKIFWKINLMKEIKNISDLSNVKKLKWYKNIFRLKLWDYRLWFSVEKDIIILERFLHRKEIYKKFPK